MVEPLRIGQMEAFQERSLVQGESIPGPALVQCRHELHHVAPEGTGVHAHFVLAVCQHRARAEILFEPVEGLAEPRPGSVVGQFRPKQPNQDRQAAGQSEQNSEQCSPGEVDDA